MKKLFLLILILFLSCVSSYKVIRETVVLDYSKYGIKFVIKPTEKWSVQYSGDTKNFEYLIRLRYNDPNRRIKPMIFMFVSKEKMTHEDVILESAGITDFKLIKKKFKNKNMIVRIGKFLEEEDSGIELDMELYSFYHRNKGIFLIYSFIDADTPFIKKCDNYLNEFLNSIEFY